MFKNFEIEYGLICEPKLPKRDDVAIASLNVVLHDIALLGTLLMLYFWSKDTKNISIRTMVSAK